MKQINCTVDATVYENFQKLYPQCLSRFVRNCIKCALEDKNFFFKIFFKEQ